MDYFLRVIEGFFLVILKLFCNESFPFKPYSFPKRLLLGMKNGFEIENSDSGGGLSIFTKMIFYLKGLFLEFSWNSGRDQ